NHLGWLNHQIGRLAMEHQGLHQQLEASVHERTYAEPAAGTTRVVKDYSTGKEERAVIHRYGIRIISAPKTSAEQQRLDDIKARSQVVWDQWGRLGRLHHRLRHARGTALSHALREVSAVRLAYEKPAEGEAAAKNLVKAHVHAYTRTSPAGQQVQVHEYENRRMPAIERSPHLTPAQKEVESRAAAAVEQDPHRFVQEYEKRFGTRVIDADKVKQLFPEYNQDPAQHAASVHEPSSALAKILYRHRLEQQPEGGRVVFTAGGGGSGKSVALRHHQPEDEHAFSYDGTLSSYQSARKLIDAALEHKQNVHVFYVHRPAGLAAHGMLKRAVESGQGRVVPGEVLAHAHYGAQQTIFQLQE